MGDLIHADASKPSQALGRSLQETCLAIGQLLCNSKPYKPANWYSLQLSRRYVCLYDCCCMVARTCHLHGVPWRSANALSQVPIASLAYLQPLHLHWQLQAAQQQHHMRCQSAMEALLCFALLCFVEQPHVAAVGM
jgi:hypothetical protein